MTSGTQPVICSACCMRRSSSPTHSKQEGKERNKPPLPALPLRNCPPAERHTQRGGGREGGNGRERESRRPCGIALPLYLCVSKIVCRCQGSPTPMSPVSKDTIKFRACIMYASKYKYTCTAVRGNSRYHVYDASIIRGTRLKHRKFSLTLRTWACLWSYNRWNIHAYRRYIYISPCNKLRVSLARILVTRCCRLPTPNTINLSYGVLRFCTALVNCC